MDTREWIQAHRSGALVHEWCRLEVTDGKRVAVLQVSADAVRVKKSDGERHREGAGARAADTVAQLLDGFLHTPRLIEERHAAATVVLEPILAPWVKRGGTAGNTTPAEHSEAVDRAIQGAENFVAYGARANQARPGDWLVDAVGKPFCADPEVDENEGVNHGWLVHKSQVRYMADRGDGKPGHVWVRAGTPVWPAVHLKDFFVCQRLGRRHGLEQDDYASPVLIVHELCLLDGQPAPTERLYTTPELCGLVTHDGRPLRSARHPGVELVVQPKAPVIIPPPPSVPRDTDPAFSLPWRDPERTPGERKLAWSLEHVGVHEQPDGSNKGPEIDVWAAETVRNGQPGFGKWLSKAGGNWCASFASAAHREGSIPGDPPAVYKSRASGFELEQDAKKAGAWRETGLVLSGAWEPEPGDVVIFPRGEPGSWKRHVARFIDWTDRRRRLMRTIDGNKSNRVRIIEGVPLTRALGFIEEPAGRDVVPSADPVEELEIGDLREDGDNDHVKAWSGLYPTPWSPLEFRNVIGHSRRWKTDGRGILVFGESAPRRTRGRPVTAENVLEAYRRELAEAVELTGVALELLIGMLCTESGRNAEAVRREPGLNDVSFGAAQTLTQTAYAMCRRLPIGAPDKPIPQGGDEEAWRRFLFVPRNAILCGASYLDYNDERFGLLGDPVLAYAAYNAGSPRPKLENAWGLVYHVYDEDDDGVPEYDAMDRFAAWFGDACEVIA